LRADPGKAVRRVLRLYPSSPEVHFPSPSVVDVPCLRLTKNSCASPPSKPSPFPVSQVWAAEPDEKEKYWFTMEQINKFPEEERKRFFNFAYEVAEGVWSSESPARHLATSLERRKGKGIK
jgi:hypothetical protein